MSRRSVLAYWNRSSSPSISMALVSHIRSVRCICRTVPARCGRTLVCDPAVPTLYKAVVFSLWVGVFSVLEQTIGGLLRGHGLAGGVAELRSTGKYELLARCLITFVSQRVSFGTAGRRHDREYPTGLVAGHGTVWQLRSALT